MKARDAPVAGVSGATSGIGEATAYRLRAHGYVVYALGRNPNALRTLTSRGLRARHLDVTDGAAVERLIAGIEAEHGRIDVLVNNAGVGLAGPLEQVDLGDLRRIFEANVVAMLHLSQCVLPGMRARATGTIVNIGSTGGRFVTPGAGPYHITKFGVSALSLTLRAEVRPFGVRVVLIEPTGVRNTGFTASVMHTRPGASGGSDPYAEFTRRYDGLTAAMSQMRGVTVRPETVARAVVRAAGARDPKPRYIVGTSGRLSVLARRLLSDRMWDRVLMRNLTG